MTPYARLDDAAMARLESLIYRIEEKALVALGLREWEHAELVYYTAQEIRGLLYGQEYPTPAVLLSDGMVEPLED